MTAAFRAQSSFQDRIIVVTDAFQKMDHFYWYVTFLSHEILSSPPNCFPNAQIVQP